MTKQVIALVFLVAVAISGIWGFLKPASVMKFKRRRNWPETLMSGGFLYATEERTETVSLVLAISCFLGAARVVWLLMHPAS
jgi:hypothetical protein